MEEEEEATEEKEEELWLSYLRFATLFRFPKFCLAFMDLIGALPLSILKSSVDGCP